MHINKVYTCIHTHIYIIYIYISIHIVTVTIPYVALPRRRSPRCGLAHPAMPAGLASRAFRAPLDSNNGNHNTHNSNHNDNNSNNSNDNDNNNNDNDDNDNNSSNNNNNQEVWFPHCSGCLLLRIWISEGWTQGRFLILRGGIPRWPWGVSQKSRLRDS